MDSQELNAWLRLTLTPGVGNATARKLLAAFGSAQAIFEQSRASLQKLGSNKLANTLRSEPPNLATQLQTTLDWLQAGDDRRRNPFRALVGAPADGARQPPLHESQHIVGSTGGRRQGQCDAR